MHRRLIATVATAALLTLLSGCALPLPIPKGPVKISVPDGPLVAPAVGDCLDDLNGVDADWRAGVPCTEPHLYDIVAIAEWPGMTKALEGRSAANVFADSTLCSIGWYEPRAGWAGMTIADDFVADSTDATEECWITGSATMTPVDCAEEHTDQSVLWFDARAAFGDAYLAPFDELDDADWDLAASMCSDLVTSVLPDVTDSLGVWATIRYPDLWDELAEAGPEPQTWYLMDCVLGSFDGARFTGDLFDGGGAGIQV